MNSKTVITKNKAFTPTYDAPQAMSYTTVACSALASAILYLRFPIGDA